jgi:hypothetical protein
LGAFGMITYADGTEPRVGDRVDDDGDLAVVEFVIDTASERAAWGVTESGLMLRSERYGLVFEPIGSCAWDAVVFLGRQGE